MQSKLFFQARSLNRRDVCRSLAGGVAAIGAAACGRQGALIRDPKTLVIGRPSDCTTLDPLFGSTGADTMVTSLVYQRPMRIEIVDGAPTGRVVGDALESWTSDPTQREWTMRMKRGHAFDDGSPLTAHALAYTVERSIKANPATIPDLAWLEESRALDDDTLQVTLAFPFHSFLFLLAHPLSAIVNPEAVAKHERNGDYGAAWLSENTAGSGPYRVSRWDKRQRLLLEPNPHTGMPARYFTAVDLRTLPDAGIRRTELSKNNIDIMTGVSMNDVGRVAELPDVEVINKESANLVLLTFNLSDPLMQDLRVRQAVGHAIDYDSLVNKAARGLATKINGLLPPGILGHDPDRPAPRRDLERARALLKEAGIAESAKITVLYNGSDASLEPFALAIQSDLADAGLNLELSPLAPAAAAQSMSTRNFQSAMYRYAIPFPDPYIVMDPIFTSFEANLRNANYSGYSDPETDDLLQKGMEAFEEDEIAAYYRKAQARVMDEVPLIPLFAMNGMLAMRDDIADLNFTTWLPMELQADRAMRRAT